MIGFSLKVICDAEFDSLTPTILWCVVCKEVETGEVHVFRYDVDKDFKEFSKFARVVTGWVGHNLLSFDVPALSRLATGLHWLADKASYPYITDSLVLSRLIHAARPGGHSMENIGKGYGLVKKPIVEYDRADLIDEYVERCISDVEINYAFYKKELERFVEDPSWQQAIQLEHDLAIICQEITDNGFVFDKPRAELMLEEITRRLDNLTQEIRGSVGPVVEVERTVTLRRKKDGTPDSRTSTLVDLYNFPSDFNHGAEFEITAARQFNPGSPKDRIRLLNDAGWRPVIKTKTHQQAERTYRRKGFKNLTEKDEARWEKLKVSGWVVNEENLKTLPKDAPTGAVKLAEWLTLEGRRADLAEWLGQYNETTGRIHSKVSHIGSWTHRCAHYDPNCANIFSAFHGEVTGPVDAVKDMYDAQLRSLWGADGYLVGTDAEGIQIRVLAHLMGDEEYIDAVANGRKEDETDIHNVNKRALALGHLIRDDAKTFIYAWLLGAGTGKVASILKCSSSLARNAVSSFIKRYPGLDALKNEQIPREARRGYFDGLDGRKVVCDSEHHMLAGHLQNGEKIIMATANVLWKKELKALGVRYRQVNFVHDEWQTETPTLEEAEVIKREQENSIVVAGRVLGLRCPLAGQGIIGRNWLETH